MTKFITMSEDEARAARKDVANSAGVIAKNAPVVPDVVRATRFDTAAREARFVMSAEVPDRMGDIVVQEGLDLTNFKANPQALLFHNSRSWPIGTWKDVATNLSGRPKRTEGTMKLMTEGEDADADRAARHLKAGTMRTVSIGFAPNYKAAEAIRDDENRFIGIKWNESELLECSLVPIPALPAAAMKELSAGMMSLETKELIRDLLDTFVIKDGALFNRADLETALLAAEGNKSFHLLDSLPAGSVLRKNDDGTVTLIEEKSAPVESTPPAPKDGEGVPVAPNPGETEKQKAETARMRAVAREHAMKSSEPRLWMDFMRKLFGSEPAPEQRADPVVIEPPADPAPITRTVTGDELRALSARLERITASASAKAAEPDPV